jgi:hypothetical protein
LVTEQVGGPDEPSDDPAEERGYPSLAPVDHGAPDGAEGPQCPTPSLLHLDSRGFVLVLYRSTDDDDGGVELLSAAVLAVPNADDDRDDGWPGGEGSGPDPDSPSRPGGSLAADPAPAGGLLSMDQIFNG